MAPPSSTLAMFGWSIMARACRSASNRATTCRVSIPGLMTLRATLRRTGWVCSAMKTTPKPPSPICSSSLYGPMTVPGASVAGGRSTVGSGPGLARKPLAPTFARSRASTAARRAASPAHARSRYAAWSAGFFATAS